MTKPNQEPTQIATSAQWNTEAALAFHAITKTGGTPGDAGVTSAAFDDRFQQRFEAAVTKTGTTSTIAQADHAKTALYTNAAQAAITIPTGLTVGSFFVLVALGAGGLTISTTTGLTFANSFTPKLTIVQGESLYVEVTASNTIIVIGGTAA